MAGLGVDGGIGMGWRSREGCFLHDLVRDLVLVCRSGGRHQCLRGPDDLPEDLNVPSVVVRVVGHPSDVRNGVHYLVVLEEHQAVLVLGHVDGDTEALQLTGAGPLAQYRLDETVTFPTEVFKRSLSVETSKAQK